MSDKLKVVIIGCGRQGDEHGKYISSFPDAKLVGFHDVIPEAAQKLAQKYGGNAYSNLAEMLDKEKPDAAFYFLPPFAHGPEMEAARRGIPFFVEKPVTLELELGKKILSVVKENNVMTSVGYMNRYRRSVNYAKQAFKEDPPVLILGGWVHGLPGIYWNMTKAKSGSPLHEQVTHSVDQGRFFAGEVDIVSAFGAKGFNKNTPSYYDIEDAAVLNVKFKSGAVGNFYLSNASNSYGGVFMNVYAYDTTAIFEQWEQNLRLFKERGAIQVTVNGEPEIFKIEDRAFLDAVKTHDPSYIKSDYEDALKTAAVTLAALTSLDTGNPIKVPQT